MAAPSSPSATSTSPAATAASTRARARSTSPRRRGRCCSPAAVATTRPIAPSSTSSATLPLSAPPSPTPSTRRASAGPARAPCGRATCWPRKPPSTRPPRSTRRAPSCAACWPRGRSTRPTSTLRRRRPGSPSRRCAAPSGTRASLLDGMATGRAGPGDGLSRRHRGSRDRRAEDGAAAAHALANPARGPGAAGTSPRESIDDQAACIQGLIIYGAAGAACRPGRPVERPAAGV